MQLTEITYDSAVPVDGYGPGFFRVAGEVIQGPMLITDQAARSWAGPDDLGPLVALSGQVDVLFLGTGADTAHPPAALREALEAVGIGVEAMASPSACRTFNVLVSEGRRIALAALPV
ncbi:Mth938-like domain-containing protein [Aliiroseovarius subalbicans]|uniref:Mth938-like domain-containing protein n=1 Tax=Aliiroseovarius subalbicans TaxID=2925840 RepID=UPI001F5ABDD0|nr:Mth938-like domain-containing protein [Aliiroseovarius subalbicans]MCI2398874.1 Mth938-like domain-containing protein [Aliiroseovarius subalbicans]